MAQTLEFNATSGLTITAKRFVVGSNTVVDSVTATEKTNDKNRYVATFSTEVTGAYRLNGFIGTAGGFSNEIYDLVGPGIFYPREEAAAGGGGGATAEEVVQELEREDGLLYQLLSKFTGIDYLAKWVRK